MVYRVLILIKSLLNVYQNHESAIYHKKRFIFFYFSIKHNICNADFLNRRKTKILPNQKKRSLKLSFYIKQKTQKLNIFKRSNEWMNSSYYISITKNWIKFSQRSRNIPKRYLGFESFKLNIKKKNVSYFVSLRCSCGNTHAFSWYNKKKIKKIFVLVAAIQHL